MTTYSNTDLATRIMRDLGLLGAEEALSGADLEWLSETIESEVSLLAALGIPVWNGSDTSIPSQYLTALSQRIGLAVAPSYGLLDPVAAQAAKRPAEQNLIVMANPRGGSPSTLRTDDATGSGRRFNWTTGI